MRIKRRKLGLKKAIKGEFKRASTLKKKEKQQLYKLKKRIGKKIKSVPQKIKRAGKRFDANRLIDFNFKFPSEL